MYKRQIPSVRNFVLKIFYFPLLPLSSETIYPTALRTLKSVEIANACWWGPSAPRGGVEVREGAPLYGGSHYTDDV